MQKTVLHCYYSRLKKVSKVKEEIFFVKRLFFEIRLQGNKKYLKKYFENVCFIYRINGILIFIEIKNFL